MPEFGAIQGLAQSGQYDQRINDERYRQQLLRQQDAMNEAKRKLFESDIEYAQGGNQWDMPIVKKRNQEIVEQIGSYVNQNPDWDTNFQKRAYVKQLKNSLKDNPDVLRATSTNDNRMALLKYAQEAKAKGLPFDEDALGGELMRYQNYERFGNPDGEEAAKKEGMKPYLFTRPQDFIDLPAAALKAGNAIKDYDVIKPVGGNIGEWYTEPKAEAVKAIKDAFYQQNARQIQVEAQKRGFTTPKQVDDWITTMISAGFDKSHSIGDPNAKFDRYIRSQELALHKAKAAREMSSNPSYTPYDYLIDPRTLAGQMNPKDIEKVWGDKTFGPVMGNNGATADLSDFNVNYDGRYIKNNGLTYFLGKINVPLNIAIERGLAQDPWLGSPKITPDYIDKAKIKTGVDKDGKEIEYVEVDYQTPINPKDKRSRDMFNANVLPDKLVEQGQNPYANQNVYSGSVAQWKAAGWSDEQIKQGVQMGKIKVTGLQ